MTQLVPENHPILNTVSTEWVFDDIAASHSLVDRMVEIMRQEGGIGLAANQIGLGHRVFVMEYDGRIWACFNPEVIKASETLASYEEGCLSFPGLKLKVKRPAEVLVKYQDKDGKIQEEQLTGLIARCYQHELDHLNGRCFTDRVSKLSLKMAAKRRDKSERKMK